MLYYEYVSRVQHTMLILSDSARIHVVSRGYLEGDLIGFVPRDANGKLCGVVVFKEVKHVGKVSRDGDVAVVVS